jgi:hypothetical protein
MNTPYFVYCVWEGSTAYDIPIIHSIHIRRKHAEAQVEVEPGVWGVKRWVSRERVGQAITEWEMPA